MGWDHSALIGVGIVIGLIVSRLFNDREAVIASIWPKAKEAPKASAPRARKPAKKGKGSVVVSGDNLVPFPAKKKSRPAKGKRKTG